MADRQSLSGQTARGEQSGVSRDRDARPPPGLLAFDGELAVGWCQLTPREALPWLDRTWRLKRVDEAAVWSLSCFYVRKGYRRRDVTSALITAALQAAKRSSTGARGLSPRRGRDAQRFQHRLCLNLCARRVQDGSPAGVAASDHAPRSRGGRCAVHLSAQVILAVRFISRPNALAVDPACAQWQHCGRATASPGPLPVQSHGFKPLH